MESGLSAALGALAGINMISGAGMLDSVACHSVEKLVIDAEAIASAERLVKGIEPRGESLATAMFAKTGLHGDFLKLEETRALFRSEQHFPSAVIERGGPAAGSDAFARARQRAAELQAGYARPRLAAAQEEAILTFARCRARKAGLDALPGIDRAAVGMV